jgi:hypothetical protein
VTILEPTSVGPSRNGAAPRAEQAPDAKSRSLGNPTEAEGRDEQEMNEEKPMGGSGSWAWQHAQDATDSSSGARPRDRTILGWRTMRGQRSR